MLYGLLTFFLFIEPVKNRFFDVCNG
jgi:hypothetical protein